MGNTHRLKCILRMNEDRRIRIIVIYQHLRNSGRYNTSRDVTLLADPGNEFGGGNYGERGSASLYGGLGALPPVGSRGKAPGQGVRGGKPPGADEFLANKTHILQ